MQDRSECHADWAGAYLCETLLVPGSSRVAAKLEHGWPMTKDVAFAVVGLGILAAGLALLLISRLRAVKDLDRPEVAGPARRRT